MSAPPLPRHVVQVGEPVTLPGGGEHVATPRCPCRPALYRDILQPMTTVYVHASKDTLRNETQ